MNFLKHALVSAALLGLVAGCGQTTKEELMVPTVAAPNALGRGMTAIILPFADYTNADDLASAFRRNLAITESLTDNLVGNGFRMVVQEDVFHYLVDQEIIKLDSYDVSGISTLVTQLDDPDWSSVMKTQIQSYVNTQNLGKSTKVAETPGAHGLSSQEVVKIGRKFGADYIIRGRILEFKTRQEHTWEPWKKGILPFVFGGSAQIAFGFAESDQYDNWNNLAAGATWGAVVGNNVGGPWNPDDPKGFFGLSGGADANVILWSAVGAAAADLASHSGKTDQAVVQLRIWVQDAYDGKVIWTNRADVKVSPESVLADRQYDGLFDQAIKKGTSALIENFVTYGLP